MATNLADTPYTTVIKYVLTRTGEGIPMKCVNAIHASIKRFGMRDKSIAQKLVSIARDTDAYIIYALGKNPGLFTITYKPIVQSIEETVDNVLSQVPANIVCGCTTHWLRTLAKLYDGNGTRDELSMATHMYVGRKSTWSRVVNSLRRSGIVPRHIQTRKVCRLPPLTGAAKRVESDATRIMVVIKLAPFGVHEDTEMPVLPNISQILADA